MRMLDLFSGIGGISLAADWAGIETVAFCEIESFCQKVLRKHWPDVPIFEDVKKLNKQALTDAGVIGNGRTIDIVAGGYPCQPFSNAGKRAGTKDDRHLWPEMFRLIKELRPTWIIGENVAGHVSLGLNDVLSDLEGEGYRARAFLIPAAAVGAMHRRDRVFVVADSDGKWESQPKRSIENFGRRIGDSSETFAYTGSAGWKEQYPSAKSNRSRYSPGSVNERGETRPTQSGMGGVLDGLSNWLDRHQWPAGLGQEQYEWEPPRVATGVKDRVGRLKALGNAVVPQQIYPIFAAIREVERMMA